MPLVADSDIPDTAPQAVENLAQAEVEGDYDELADLLVFLGNSFVENDSGDLALAVPSYDAGDVPSGLSPSESGWGGVVVEGDEIHVTGVNT